MRPSKRLIQLVVLFALMIVASRQAKLDDQYWIILIIVFSSITLFDLSRLKGKNVSAAIKRSLPSVFLSDEVIPVRYSVKTDDPTIRLADLWPGHIQQDIHHELSLSENNKHQLSAYNEIHTEKRGEVNLKSIQIIIDSDFKLWERIQTEPCETQFRVFPDFSPLARDELLGTEGLKGKPTLNKNQSGLGQEFHELREYHPGDSLRHIDWPATARMRKLISRQYNDEIQQRVVIMLDASRALHNPQTRLFDQALNASLQLAYSALKQGDLVGFEALSNQPLQIKPESGLTQFKNILNRVYDLDSTTNDSDLGTQLTHSLAQHHRQTLFILITNLLGGDSDELKQALQRVGLRHGFLIAFVKDPALGLQQTKIPENEFQAAQLAGIYHYNDRRRREINQLKSISRTHILDVEPNKLAGKLISTYLALHP
ncbi:MAG: DUF58 domain-containing protein [bacterium]